MFLHGGFHCRRLNHPHTIDLPVFRDFSQRALSLESDTDIIFLLRIWAIFGCVWICSLIICHCLRSISDGQKDRFLHLQAKKRDLLSKKHQRSGGSDEVHEIFRPNINPCPVFPALWGHEIHHGQHAHDYLVTAFVQPIELEVLAMGTRLVWANGHRDRELENGPWK